MEQQAIIGQVARFSRIVFPSTARERNMAFCSAYFDESTGNGSPILVVAGFLSTDAQWAQFESEWKAVLADFGITAFHMQHFEKRKGKFRVMQKPVRKKLFGALIEIIKNRAAFGFACATHILAFNEVFQGRERTAVGSPVAFFYDTGHNNSGEVAESFVSEKNDSENTEYRLGSLTFADDELVVPLQAADIAAYELWKWLDEHYASKPRHGRYPLQELIKMPWQIREFDKDVLIELRELRRGQPGNPRTIRHLIPALRPRKTDAK